LRFRLRALTLFGRSFQTVPLPLRLPFIEVPQPRIRFPEPGLGCSPFARRYLGNRVFLLFLEVLRCFSTEGCQPAKGSQSHKADLSSDCRLQLACMKSESLVSADQQAALNTFPGLDTPPVTPRKPAATEVACANRKDAGAEGMVVIGGEVVTKVAERNLRLDHLLSKSFEGPVVLRIARALQSFVARSCHRSSS